MSNILKIRNEARQIIAMLDEPTLSLVKELLEKQGEER